MGSHENIHYGPTQFENFFGDLTKLADGDSAGVPKSIRETLESS
jgi:hypothetical protein